MQKLVKLISEYKSKDRRLNELIKILEKSRDYSSLILNRQFYYEDSLIYRGYEHNGKPKLPNITILPNLISSDGRLVLGSSLGHQHCNPSDSRDYQEIYEFHGYGGMIIKNSSDKRIELDLYFLKPLDKIFLYPSDHMTILNFDFFPLLTLDYSNPMKNFSTKKEEESKGPLTSFVFTPSLRKMDMWINPNYLPLSLSDRIIRLGENVYLGEPFFNQLQNLQHIIKPTNRLVIRLYHSDNKEVYRMKPISVDKEKELREQTLMTLIKEDWFREYFE